MRTLSITALATATVVSIGSFANATVIDGALDSEYGAAIATDPAGDLATNGPADWSGTHWPTSPVCTQRMMMIICMFLLTLANLTTIAMAIMA